MGASRNQLLVREGDNEWVNAHLEVCDTELRIVYRKHGKDEEVLFLSREHYVGDSGARKNAFLVSDLVETKYFATDSENDKQVLMQSIATTLRELGTRSHKSGTPPHRESVARPKITITPPSAAAVRLQEAEKRYELALRKYNLALKVKKDAEKRANERLHTLEEYQKKEAERIRIEEEREATAKRRREELERQAEHQRKVQEERLRKQKEQAELLVKQKQEQERKQKQQAEEEKERKRKEQQERETKAAKASSSPPASPATEKQQSAGGLASKVSMWNTKVSSFRSKQEENPFSGSGNSQSPASVATSKSSDYGKPKPGSKTEERAIAAQAWVEKEIAKFVKVVKDIGDSGQDGEVTVTFHKLFIAYQDISDSLVGMMMRAKKRGIIHYEGDMLFQGKDNDVVITLRNK